VYRDFLGYFFLARIFSIIMLLGFLPFCKMISRDVYVMLGGGTSRFLWLGGDGATSPMEKRACKKSLN
jgi:hypothetical protein